MPRRQSPLDGAGDPYLGGADERADLRLDAGLRLSGLLADCLARHRRDQVAKGSPDWDAASEAVTELEAADALLQTKATSTATVPAGAKLG